MSVEVWPEPGGVWVVVCLHDDCADCAVTLEYGGPWVAAFTTRREADACAREHRQVIRDQDPCTCAACGQVLPSGRTVATADDQQRRWP